MKMSDVFALPVYRGVQEVNIHNKERPCIISGTNTTVIARPKYIEATIHAINNHDRMVEEIATLKGAIEAAVRIKELWLPTIAFSDNPPEHYTEIEALHKMANKFERALAKLSKDK